MARPPTAPAEDPAPMPSPATLGEPPVGTAAMTLPHDHPDYEFPKEVHNMLAVALTTHVQLSAMADSKASILMGATFLVFTLTIGQLAGSTGTVSAPILILGIFSFAATVLSVLAVMPKIAMKVGPSANFLFFGVFSRIPQDDYVDQVIATMRSEEATYRAMARDLYQNGVVLQGKKYYYLARAYQFFLAGLVLTLATFLVQLAIKLF